MPPRSLRSVALRPKAPASAAVTSSRSVAASAALSRPGSVTYPNVRKCRICWWVSTAKLPSRLGWSPTRTSRGGGARADQPKKPARTLINVLRWHDSLRAPATDDDEVLMTRTRVPPVLVTGATGRVGRVVVDLLIDAGVPVRALTHRSEAAATLPANVEVVTGDLTVPESLDAGLRGVSAVFLVWTAPPTTAPAVVERLATYARRVVFLSSPHQTPHPFFQQPNAMAVLHADIERLIAAAGLESTIIRPGMFASNALFWWAAAIRAGGAVRWPYGAAETAPVDDRDVAAVAARTLYQDGHAGGDYVLTGSESLSQAEQVSIIGDVLGRPIHSRSYRRKGSGVRRRVAGPLRSWTCCSTRGVRRSDTRRT